MGAFMTKPILAIGGVGALTARTTMALKANEHKVHVISTQPRLGNEPTFHIEYEYIAEDQRKPSKPKTYSKIPPKNLKK